MGAFSKRADEVLGADWRERLQGQTERLRKHVPTSEDVARKKALEIIKRFKEQAYNAGVMAHVSRRAQNMAPGVKKLQPVRDIMPGVSGREVTLSLPEVPGDASLYKTSGIFDFVINPLREKAEDMKLDTIHMLDKIRANATKVTTSPSTLTSFYPTLASIGPSSFVSGFSEADKTLDEQHNREMEENIQQARKEFEQALQEEYVQGRAKHAGVSSPGELIDGLAQLHVKKAEGELNQMLGAYLALASLMGQGTNEFARRWVEKRDPKRQEYKALREAITRRMQARPPSMQFEPIRPSRVSASPEIDSEEITADLA
jgi:hypothetical protein